MIKGGVIIEEINRASKKYPSRLLEIQDYPKTLYVEGNMDLLNKPGLAIVGSRMPTEYGKVQAKRFAKYLSQNGICIISGLARGIDTIAHTNSMSEKGGTIAVIASGINNIYPPENKILVEKILENGGLVISEWEPNEGVYMSRFPRRNRIISGLADGVLVVEANAKSGSNITARYAKKQRKEVFCIPGKIDEKRSVGCNKLIQEGASLVMSPKEIMQILEFEPEEDKIALDEEYEEIYGAICSIEQSADEIARRLNKSIQEVNEKLFILEVDGFIKSLPGDKYVRI